MDEDRILLKLKAVGAIKTDDHFVYTSGKHGSAYVNKDAVYPDTERTATICNEFAKSFAEDSVETVIGPALGGIILSQWTAACMTTNLQCLVWSVYAEKDDNKGFVIKRGYDEKIQGKRVLVVEDVVTTGGSVKKVIEAVRTAGGNVVGVGVLCNRGGITADDLNVPKLVSLTKVDFQTWEESECPMCLDKTPVNTKIGKGAEFLALKAAQT